MADFDFFVPSRLALRESTRNFLRLAQRLADPRDLHLTFRWCPEGRFRVTVYGRLTALQSFMEALALGLTAFAEGSVSQGPIRTRRRIAAAITQSYADALDATTDSIETVSRAFGGMPYSYYFDAGSATHLQGHLDSLTQSLTLYHQGRVQAMDVAEQLHTVLELFLRHVLGSESKSHSFKWMVEAAVRRGIVGRRSLSPLLRLKDARRDSKHHGQAVSEATLDRLLPLVVSAIHRLTRAIALPLPAGTVGA
jgi:hypothetical protein